MSPFVEGEACRGLSGFRVWHEELALSIVVARRWPRCGVTVRELHALLSSRGACFMFLRKDARAISTVEFAMRFCKDFSLSA